MDSQSRKNAFEIRAYSSVQRKHTLDLEKTFLEKIKVYSFVQKIFFRKYFSLRFVFSNIKIQYDNDDARRMMSRFTRRAF